MVNNAHGAGGRVEHTTTHHTPSGRGGYRSWGVVLALLNTAGKIMEVGVGVVPFPLWARALSVVHGKTAGHTHQPPLQRRWVATTGAGSGGIE